MANEKKPRRPLCLTPASTAGEPYSTPNEDDSPTDPRHSSPSATSQTKLPDSSSSEQNPLHSPRSPPARQGPPRPRLPFLDQHTDVDVIHLIFTDPNHVSFAGYWGASSRREPAPEPRPSASRSLALEGPTSPSPAPAPEPRPSASQSLALEGPTPPSPAPAPILAGRDGNCDRGEEEA